MSESVLQSDATAFEVYTGLWIDWTHGRYQGATLTLSRDTGGLLIAFLALYVSTTGQSFWRLGCFFLHRMFSSSERQDGLYHQRQAILRNAESAHNTVLALICTGYYWRKIAEKPWRRLSPLLTFAVTIAGAFSVAGIFSSKVTTQNDANEVLLKGSNCGVVTHDPEGNRTAYDFYIQDHITAYLNYAIQCYANSHAAISENCRTFVKPKLAYSIDRNAPCPFAEELCALKSGNLVLDTGLLDSHYDFGVNAPPKDRFQLRNRVECAPLVTKGFSELHVNRENPSLSTMRYFYGQSDMDYYTRGNGSFTFQVPANFSSDRVEDYTLFQASNPDYYIGSAYWSPVDDNKVFDPIPKLMENVPKDQIDRDLDLFILSAPGVVYRYETDDPWFSAHQPSNFSKIFASAFNGTEVFTRDEPAGVIACTSQVQYCNPSLPEATRCEPVSSYESSYFNSSTEIFPNTDRLSMSWAKNISIGSIGIQISLPYQTAGIAALRARFGLRVGMQNNPLPSNQWQIEMEHLFQASIASYQFVFTETANGPLTPDIEEQVQRPLDKPSRSMCRNQKIISSRYYSFNVLGMAIILALGTTIIFLDYTIEYIVEWIDRRLRKTTHERTYARLEWASNSTLQLQRLAHEELGLGTWRSCAGQVPVTEPGEKLGLLDVTDEHHPLLVRPNRWAPPIPMRADTTDSQHQLLRQDSDYTLKPSSTRSILDKNALHNVRDYPVSPLRDSSV